MNRQFAHRYGRRQTKCKQSKAEASTVQGRLQKEITGLREAHRTTQLKLRDIEVANDDIERQARHTSSSLEDLESKYNVAIERAVLLEAEVQLGEQERESLRIEAQRLRDELSDLRIEADIQHEKVRRFALAADQHPGRPRPLPAIDTPRPPRSVKSEVSPASTVSSPMRTTPPPLQSTSTSVSETPTPPSPPASDVSAHVPASTTVPVMAQRSRASGSSHHPTRRSTVAISRLQRPSFGLAGGTPPSPRPVPAGDRHPTRTGPDDGSRATIPSSGSLRQIRGLIGQVQRLEQRVQSARSRLPAPPTYEPRAGSPGASGDDPTVPASVTVRSQKKRLTGSILGVAIDGDPETTPLPRRRGGRMSSNIPVTPSAVVTPRGDGSRPSSRASAYSHHSTTMLPRPGSRASIGGVRTPLGGHHYVSTTMADGRRPRSSLAGHRVGLHGASASVHLGWDEVPPPDSSGTPTPRRNVIHPNPTPDGSVPTPASLMSPSTMTTTTTATTTTMVTSSSSSSSSSMRRPSGVGFRPVEPLHSSSSASSRPEREGTMGPPERHRRLSGASAAPSLRHR